MYCCNPFSRASLPGNKAESFAETSPEALFFLFLVQTVGIKCNPLLPRRRFMPYWTDAMLAAARVFLNVRQHTISIDV